MIFDHLDNAGLYPLGPRWEQALAFLRTLNADSADGDYPLDGDNLIVKVMGYETKAPEAGVIESHRKYADIQICLEGVEGIDLFDTERLDIRTPYAAENDVTFYQLETAQLLSRVNLYPGYFAYLLPRDAHRPQMLVDAPRTIKKAVAKVALD